MLIGLFAVLIICGFSDKVSAQQVILQNNLRSSFFKTQFRFPLEDKDSAFCYFADTLKQNSNHYFRNFSDSQKEIILALNRISESRVKENSVLIVPKIFSPDLLDYAPFPVEIDTLLNVGKCILISQRVQAFAVYQNGRLIRWGPISTGAKSTPTPNGLFYTNWKSRLKTSTINSDWIMPWYFNLDNKRGIALHEYVLPGYPASHGCIRLFEQDAIWIYNWADQWKVERYSNQLIQNGTPVIIFGWYNFNEKQPWYKLIEDVNANFLLTDEFNTLCKFVADIK